VKKIPLVLVLVLCALLALSGCSLWDGLTGAPMETVDSPTWYHIGQAILPILSQILALIRRALLPGAP
jgi:hypothetical protein